MCNYLYVYILMNDYLYVFIPMREFLFSVNVYVFILMVLSIFKKWGFLFSVNVYVFIPMVPLMVKNFKKISKIGIHRNWGLFMCIYSNEKFFLWCKCICIYSYGAFYS